MIHLNARSLKNRVNLHQIREFTQEHKPDIIAISESWLNSTVTNAEIEIEGFKVIRLDRLHKIGGGVCAYVRSNIKCFKMKHLSTISEDNFHQLWLRIQFKKLKSFLICVTYRPPECSLNCFESHFKPAYTEAPVLENHAPIKNIKIKSRPTPFVDDEIKLAMKERDQLHENSLRLVVPWIG